MNRREVLAGGSLAAGGAALATLKLDVREFGARGDGVADDAPAIQAALDHAGARGGGAVFLRPPPVNYRIATGMKLPSYVMLEGAAPVRYPFNAGNKGACALVADFRDPMQWVVEPATRSGGRAVPHDRILTGGAPDGVTYNCGVRDLLITSTGRPPYGGVRMHGCPGSFLDGVSIDRVGCGLLVNASFGGSYRAQVHSLHYGVAVWEDANANVFEVYCAHSTPYPATVPDEYRLAFLREPRGALVDVQKLSTDDHLARPFGLLCGAKFSTSTNNVFDLVVERFPGGMFLLNAYATDFRRCYLEADAGRMAAAIVASRSRFGVQALHAYLSGTGALFDLGMEVQAKVYAGGVLHTASFGGGPYDDGSSFLILENVDPAMRGAPMQPGVRYAAKSQPWVPLRLLGGWRGAGGDFEVPAVRLDPWSHRIELQGTMTGGGPGICFALPPGLRPRRRRRYAVPGGRLEIGPNGAARVSPAEPGVSLDGVAFDPW